MQHLHDTKTPTPFPEALLKRFSVDLKNKTISSRVLCDQSIEYPHINYQSFNTKQYRYVYATRFGTQHEIANSLVKIDTDDGSSVVWEQDNCYPTEPVFVAQPNAKKEDDGILLSVVLDARNQTSFLLMLNASTLQEIGRAIVPQTLPFTLHGRYFSKQELDETT